MKITFVFFLSLSCFFTLLFAQNQTVKIFDIQDDAQDCSVASTIEFGDKFIVTSNHSLQSQYKIGAQLTIIDRFGEPLDSIVMPGIGAAREEPTIFDGNFVYLFGIVSPEFYVFTGETMIFKIDKDLSVVDTIIFPAVEEEGLATEGIQKISDKLYVYESRQYDGRNGKAVIIQMDSLTNQYNWRKEYLFPGDFSFKNFSIHSLQQKEPGVLGFIVYVRYGRFILEIDENTGEELTRRYLAVGGSSSYAAIESMVIDAEGKYIFCSQAKVYADTTNLLGHSLGAINKVSLDADSTVHSIPFFEYSFSNPKLVGDHKPIRTIIAKNGDFIVIGVTQDYDDGRDDHGFIIRFSPDLEMKWNRFYKHKLLEGEWGELDEIGKYKYSNFKEIIEQDDGSFVVTGEANYFKEVDGEKLFFVDFLFMSLDENGCFNGNCQEEYVVSNNDIVVEDYDGVVFPNPTSDIINIDGAEYDSYLLLNQQGQTVKRGDFEQQIDLSRLSKGIYYLQLQKSGKFYKAIPIVKE